MLLCLMMAGSLNVHAQKARNRRMGIKADSIIPVSYTHLTLPTTPYV